MQNQIGLGVLESDWPAEVASTLNAAFGSKMGLEDQHVNGGCPLFVPVAHTLTSQGFDASEDGTGRGTPLVPVVFDSKGTTVAVGEDGSTPTLRAMNSAKGRPNAGGQLAIAFQNRFRGDDGRGYGRAPPITEGVVGTLETVKPWMIVQRFAVRRLTPTECERLQGFPDDFTQVPRGNKPMSDGARYRMIGNSMAVNVMQWVGHRIDVLNKSRAA